jgi:uncharacterized delta-60 repeat protein
MTVRACGVVIAFVLAAGLSANPAHAPAAPGDLDPSFSGDGWTRILDLRSAGRNFLPEGAEDVAVQPDGKVVTAGGLPDGDSNDYFGALRFLADGDLDPSFGGGGLAHTDLGSFARPSAVAVQADGKIVVAGATSFTLARYLPDGRLDPSFGAGGISRHALWADGGLVYDLIVQPDGKLVAVGSAYPCEYLDCIVFGAVRYLPDGRLDPSFSRNGRTRVSFGYGQHLAHAATLQGDGKIVVAGAGRVLHDPPASAFAIARFRRDGRLDRSFSGDGRALVRFGRGRADVARGVAIGGRGRIVAAGYSARHEGRGRLTLVRLRRDGRLDRSFGRRGRARVAARGASLFGSALLLDPAGRILVGGGLGSADVRDISSDWALVRFGPGGKLDRSFGGGDGLVTTDFGTGEDRIWALARQGEKIVAAGQIYRSAGVARYLPD